MTSIIQSILGIYLFIAVGFVAKMSFKDQIHDRTITLISVYFLQLFLTFWGLFKRPIDVTLLYVPMLYLIIVVTVLIVIFPLVKWLFKEPDEQPIAMVAALMGNTGNLGLPLCMAIFGEASIPYVTVINLANLLFIYTIGVFFYSRGHFSIRESLWNIVKLPVLWAAMIAILLNLYGYQPGESFDQTLQMGAYSSLVLQLMLFGISLYGVTLSGIKPLLFSWVMLLKFLILPLLAFMILSRIELDAMIKGVLFIELIVPLAIVNVLLSSLYNGRTKDIAALVFVSSLLFLGIIFVVMEVINWL